MTVPAVDAFFAALDRADLEASRLALHPYLRWTCADGTMLVGRNRVLEHLGLIARRRPRRSSCVTVGSTAGPSMRTRNR